MDHFRRTRTDGVPLTLPARPPHATAHQWLCSALRVAILDGVLRPGARLPGSRDLARQCRVARGTVVAAFEQMKAEGYVSAHTGSGSYVNTVLPDSLLEVVRPPATPQSSPPPHPPRRLSTVGKQLRPFPPLSPHRARAFRANQPALDLFPTTLWAQVAGRRLRRATVDLLRGCEPFGYLPLRHAVADYLRRSRGVRCRPEQVAIVSGVQEALDLVARLFVNPGDRVCVEDPGYIGAALALEGAGARLSPVPIDAEGITLPTGRHRRARLIYVTPAHQFPLGVSMSVARRLALIDWARRTGALIVEDDYDSEYRYAGLPVPALQGLDRHGVVLFAGSFSKVLCPALRLGYLVVPEDLVERVSALKSIATRFEPLLDQAVLCDFITEGHFGRHVRRMRGVYAERLSVLLESARQLLDGALDVSDIEAGLQTAGWLRRGIAAAAVATKAAERGVEVIPLSRYTRRAETRQGLLLGFAAVDAREIRRGVRELARVLERPARY
jgi:GntR family transcriptional regulator / MocR family aminotransferase